MNREPEFKGYWSDKEKQIWQNTNWQERNYEELPIEDDTFEGTGYFYSMTGKLTKKITFVKYIRSNPIYSPYYAPIYTAELKEYMKAGSYCYPCYDGRTEGQYDIHDRFDTSELADHLSN